MKISLADTTVEKVFICIITFTSTIFKLFILLAKSLLVFRIINCFRNYLNFRIINVLTQILNFRWNYFFCHLLMCRQKVWIWSYNIWLWKIISYALTLNLRSIFASINILFFIILNLTRLFLLIINVLVYHLIFRILRHYLIWWIAFIHHISKFLLVIGRIYIRILLNLLKSL